MNVTTNTPSEPPFHVRDLSADIVSREQFARDGFCIIPRCIFSSGEEDELGTAATATTNASKTGSHETETTSNEITSSSSPSYSLAAAAASEISPACEVLIRSLRDVLNGKYDTGVAPAKMNRLPARFLTGPNGEFDYVCDDEDTRRSCSNNRNTRERSDGGSSSSNQHANNNASNTDCRGEGENETRQQDEAADLGVSSSARPATSLDQPHQRKQNNKQHDYPPPPPRQQQQQRQQHRQPPQSRTIHLINVWRSSSAFARLVLSPSLGRAVVALMGWEAHGCRVAQDQVWAKPPHSSPLTFHRDTPYLDFDPKQVCTVWVPLDDVRRPGVGTLEYCAGSHRWRHHRHRGSANMFYDKDYQALLRAAAEQEQEARQRSRNARERAGAEEEEEEEEVTLRLVPVLGEAGCCSLHDGATWHGSPANTTGGWRRGIGIHFVRGDATLAADAGPLWRRLAPQCVAGNGGGGAAATALSLPDDLFPMTCPPQQ